MKVLVLGGTSMVAKHLRQIRPNWIYWGSKDCDLLNYTETYSKIQYLQPDVVINLAAMVGGVDFNQRYQEAMFHVNTRIGLNALSAMETVRHKGGRLIQILSTCMYGDWSDEDYMYPMHEQLCCDGPLEPTNYGYGLAKRFLKQTIDFNRSLGYDDCCLIPCNLYSEFDNFDANKSHFVASLVKKIHYAKTNGLDFITNWGDGTPLRQFMYAGDLANAIDAWVYYNCKVDANVSVEENYSISEITNIALEACNADLRVVWDSSKPNGIYRKDVSVQTLKTQIPWKPRSLKEGIKRVYNKYDNTN